MGDILSEQAESTDEKFARQDDKAGPSKQIPRGVVLGKDGKPCRSCTSFASWAALTKSSTKTSPSTSTSGSTTTSTSTSATTTTPPTNCPPDVSVLGNHTWTLLHTLTANYPATAPTTHQRDMRQFLSLFSKLYPCWVCADDFRSWMDTPGNEPRLASRDEFGRWMCRAHNDVNRKLGKEVFDCDRWEERWRTGWRDGSCD